MEITCLDKFGAPKWLFILYLAVNGRLATKDRLAKWGVIQSPICPLCQRMNEELEHLFFQCSYTAEVWSSILAWQGINRGTLNWTGEVHWAIKYMKGRGRTALVYKLAMASSLYYLWLERNSRVFTQKKRQSSSIIRHIIQETHGRGSRYPKLATRLQELNMYP